MLPADHTLIEVSFIVNEEASTGENLNHEGALIITSAAAPEIRIEDWLIAPIRNLCFAALAPLLRGQPIAIEYFQHSGAVRFEPQGAEVLVSGELVPRARLPLQPLVIALYACGVRFIEYLRGLPRTDAGHAANIHNLEQFARAAEAAMRQHGLLR